MDPITGPLTSVEMRDIDGLGSYRTEKTKWKQAKPYNLCLPYRHKVLWTTYAHAYVGTQNPAYWWLGGMANANTGKSPWWWYATPNEFGSEIALQVMDKARANFQNAISEQAEHLVTLAERRKGMEMLTKRLLQFYGGLKEMKRGNVLGALREWGSVRGPDRSWRRKAGKGDFADLFLELHFGWEPVIKDVQSSLKILDQDFDTTPVKGSSTYNEVLHDLIYQSSYYGYSSDQYTHHRQTKCRVGARVRVTNPNLFLASRMGLLNPVTVLFEVTKFSFVADWFVNLSDYFGQWTDLFGLSVEHAYHTVFSRDWAQAQSVFVHNFDPTNNNNGRFVVSDSVYTERKLGIPGVTLGLRRPWTLSATRAATIAALIVQALPRR